MWYGVKMFKFFATQEVADTELAKFNGLSEKKKLKKKTIDVLKPIFARSEEKSFSRMLRDGKDRISPDKSIKQLMKEL